MGLFERFTYVPGTIEDHLHVRLLAVDCLRLNRHWRAEGVRDSFWRLYVNRQAGAVIRYVGQNLPILPGSAMLIPAWVVYDCRAAGSPEHLFVHFDPVGWPGATVRRVFDRPVVVRMDAAMLGVSESLIRRLARGPGRDQASLSLAKAMVHMVLAADLAARDASGELDQLLRLAGSPVGPAMRLAEEGSTQRHTVDSLAAACGMSRSHFSRMFREAVGQPPAKYLLERRIARCAERLALTDESIKHVAETGGFSDRFHFARAFGRVMGVPPATYRDAARR